MKLLCLSNGHGEDSIAARILEELRLQAQDLDQNLELAALPLVGQGVAYRKLDVPLVGPVKAMPSGGFVYMDGRQLARDVGGGLVQLTLAQLRAIRQWSESGDAVLAVGDIVPLLMAWLSGAPYAFVGTAKSEYHLRDEQGPLPRQHWSERFEGWSGSVYLPWERWLLQRKRCRAVFPRDPLTAQILKRFHVPVFDLGNPMMDGLEPQGFEFESEPDALVVTLLPGSRAPEAYRNWQQILAAVEAIVQNKPARSVTFLAALSPELDLEQFGQLTRQQSWSETAVANRAVAQRSFKREQVYLHLIQGAFADCLHKAHLGLAMAGTATEQLVGLGKPVICFPGGGPQFTYAFAEAQTRLLGPSLTLVQQPTDAAAVVTSLLQDPDRLQLCGVNGRQRMGEAGAAGRIACCLRSLLLNPEAQSR
ncbi:lipid-A-disaccharide synthase-related protein [Leptolyngbya sp. FACHB-261]|uniref:lipid-A-disaccharide synthase-related protein n=1 Tax=Leptolyngbya sp. FACHB-261 TaxID=2692806 RepID=UPI0016860270|nr:lipid-A-disaccharide synthase-related protein [Leptolyngbya sp. FACHB-261]MBD2100751.1 hypothetical protein [Leptolyngbya sp. FACHB-261]